VEEMQVQSNHADAILIGSLKLPITPTGMLTSAKNSGKKELFIKPMFHDQNLVLDDNFCTDSHVDFLARASTSGLPQVAGVVATAGLPLAGKELSAQQLAIGRRRSRQLLLTIQTARSGPGRQWHCQPMTCRGPLPRSAATRQWGASAAAVRRPIRDLLWLWRSVPDRGVLRRRCIKS
jgi:hypothetical protein